MNAGCIYILTNHAMPGLVKVGKTTRGTGARADQLSSATGVPAAFEVYRRYEVLDCDEAERYVHLILERVFERPNLSREFFLGTPADVASTLDGALRSRQLKPDTYSLEYFQSGMRRLLLKEFTLGCMEFEDLFRGIRFREVDILASDALQTAAAAYLTCCFAGNRAPFLQIFVAPAVKGTIMEKAIKFATAFDSDPVMRMIEFVRSNE